ncbi:MAG: SdrD B-like domain-containing protein, partial [Actinomycetes bacterium]
YSWSEKVPAGWTLTGIKCSGTDSENVKVDASTVTVTPDAGEDVTCTYTNTKLAKVTIAKSTDPTSAPDKFSFSGPGDPAVSFELANGESKPFADLTPGQGYSWSEKVPSGWTLTGIKCSGTDSENVKVDASTVTVTPGAGEDVTCTYTNTKLAKVTIAKATDPTSATDKFSFSGPGDPPASFELANGESKPFADLAPGKDYAFTEKVPSGWTLTGIKCTGTDPENVKVDASTVSVKPEAGEDVTCTYTNTKLAKVTIAKSTDPSSATDKFSFSGPGDPPASFELANGESKPFADLAPGKDYAFTETVPSGWTLTGIKCVGTDSENVKVDASTVTVTPDAGEDVTCTYTNTKLAKVTIAKATNPTSATDKFSFSGPGDPPASFELANGESKPFGDLAPGKGYSWSEKVPAGWTLTGIKCSGTDSENVKVDSSTVTVTPDAGEAVTCTYTNTKLAKVTIAKATDPAAAPDKFDFTGPGDPPVTFQLADGESKPFADLAPGASYPFAEKSPAGWSVTSIKCSGTDPANVKTDVQTGSVTVTPQAGEEVNCTYSNTQQRGSIAGFKFNDLNGNGVWDKPEEPALEGWKVGLDKDSSGTIDPGEPVATTDATGAYSFTDLLFASYTVLELPAADQATPELQAFKVCSLPKPDCAKGYSVTLNVETPNATDKTFGNYVAPKLELRKAVDPTTDTGTFNLLADGGTGGDQVKAENVGNGGTSGAGGTAVKPGGYALSEEVATGTLPDDYVLGTAACFNRSDGSPVTLTEGSLTLSGGQDVYCSWTNTRKAKLELRKQVGPASDTGKFDLFANTVPAGPDPAVSAINVGNGSTFSPTSVEPGTYALSEAAHVGTPGGDYTFGDPECFNRSDDSPVTVTNGQVTLAAGQDVYCSWLNIRTQAFIKGNSRIGGTTGCARGRYAYARIAGSPIRRVTWYVNHKRYTSQVKRNAGRYFQLKLRVSKLHRSYYAITAVVNYTAAAIAPRTVKRKLAFRICRPLRSTG